VWLCLLALADKEGRIDSTIPYIAAVTGVPAEVLTECIGRFTAPDPASRTKTDDGRRLVLIDPERAWGWRVVNHAKYKEKARLLGKNQREIESGKNKERMDDRRRPPETAKDRLSDSYANTNTNTNTNKEAAAPQLVDGLNQEAWSRWESYRREIRKPIKPASILAAQRKLAGFGSNQLATVENSIAEGYTGLFPPKENQQRSAASDRKRFA
jgi:hypothetical protein